MDPLKEKNFNEFLAMIQKITRIKSLRNVEFKISFKELKKENLEAFKRVLLDFHQVVFIKVDTYELDFNAGEKLDKRISQVNLRQSLRCDLMF